MACNIFSRQAVGAQGQPQGQQLQGHYQQPYHKQQGQGHFQEHFQLPYREQPQMKESPGQHGHRQQLTGQLHQQLTGQLHQQQLEEHKPNSLHGLYSHSGVKAFGGTSHAADFAAPLLSNASCASHANLQHAASGNITAGTQPIMDGPRHSQVLQTAASAAMLPCGVLMPLASGSGQKRKAHMNQVDDLESTLEDMLANLAAAHSLSSACWTASAGNHNGAAHADGHYMREGLTHMAQVQAIAQQLLPVAAAAAETKQHAKKQKTGQTSSSFRTVYRGPVPRAVHGPALCAACPLAHGAESDQATLLGDGAILQGPSLQSPPLAGGPLQPSPLEPQQPFSAPHAGAPSHSNASRLARVPQPQTDPLLGLNPLQPPPQACQAEPNTQAWSHPQALPRRLRQRKPQTRPKAQPSPDAGPGASPSPRWPHPPPTLQQSLHLRIELPLQLPPHRGQVTRRGRWCGLSAGTAPGGLPL